MQISVYTDGGSRGNPGISGYGLVIYNDHNQIIYQESKFLGIKANNESEYAAFLGALVWINNNIQKLNITQISFYADSQLLVCQIQGKYKVKAANLKPLFDQAHYLIDQLKIPYQFQHVLRSVNELADQLANHAMDHPHEI
jgi:ribonuclease HI